jgi:hypothetical protein
MGRVAGLVGLVALCAGCVSLPGAEQDGAAQATDAPARESSTTADLYEPQERTSIPGTPVETSPTRISRTEVPVFPGATYSPPAVPSDESDFPETIPESLLEQIIQNLADQLDLNSSDIQVVLVEAATWNDSSLGCPEKGMAYLQVITPGYRVILAAQGRQYDYRTDTLGNFRLCSR